MIGRPAPAVIPAAAADLVLLSHVIAEAFHPLPPSQWLIPDLDARRDIFPRYFALLAEGALAAGTVTTVPGRTAAALWLPPGAPDPDRYDERLAAITGSWAGRFAAFDEALHQVHPAGVEHLAILGVQPGRQGQGTGSALLDARHAQLDATGATAYLEAASPRARQLYLRHGYADHGPPIRLPDGGPLMYPMVRRAKSHIPSELADRRDEMR
jgi:GNAT superfamily N-acetyltransferase